MQVRVREDGTNGCRGRQSRYFDVAQRLIRIQLVTRWANVMSARM